MICKGWCQFDWDYDKKKWVCINCKKEITKEDANKEEHWKDAFL